MFDCNLLNQVCRADGVTYVIVWDNVRFHHAQMVQAWFQAQPQFTTLFLLLIFLHMEVEGI